MGLILVSNRGPVSYRRGDSGELETVRGGGGLVTALLGVAASRPVTWIASAMTPEDTEVWRRAAGGSIALEHDEYRLSLRFINAGAQAYERYYNVIANPLIWFIQHYLWGLAVAPEIGEREISAWDEGYVAVNRLFADAVCRELEDGNGEGGRPLVMLHDYHLYLCPALVRERHPQVFLHQFIHIPWPQPDSWLVLPRRMRQAIMNGALANDIIAFHTGKYVRNFLLSCEELPGVEVDQERGVVMTGGREVWVRAYPVSIDGDDFDRLAGSAAVLEEEGKIKAARRGQLILRVDRMDLSKNIVRGFKAYDIFLEKHPEFRERVTFLALMQPSREDIREYGEYRRRIAEVVEAVNNRHGTADWRPIDLRMQDDFPCSVAAYKQFDALLVNAIFDGMNLIAKEAGLVNTRDGVLILSENTGVHEELGEFALTVNPFDLEDQARAIHQALTMDDDAKRRRAGKIKQVVRKNDINRWIERQFDDIKLKGGGES
ncbi:trehalose-phosphate synthase [bacterium BMS3Abin01]|nr:trehalose-phosphate synthase [bacterium BMS3Abin01]